MLHFLHHFYFLFSGLQSQLAIAVNDCTDSIKMSESSVEKYDGFCIQINDKPVDAIGHMIFISYFQACSRN